MAWSSQLASGIVTPRIGPKTGYVTIWFIRQDSGTMRVQASATAMDQIFGADPNADLDDVEVTEEPDPEA